MKAQQQESDMQATSKIKPVTTLPAVLAIVGVDDGGPCSDGQATNACPHCGADGRYVIQFMCEDGQVRGAMRGCFQLFPGSNTKTSKLVQMAFEKQRTAAENKTKLAGWWADMIAEIQDFRDHGTKDDFPLFCSRIFEIDDRRQSWLKRNGYGRSRH
jgi:hypothetical protein